MQFKNKFKNTNISSKTEATKGVYDFSLLREFRKKHGFSIADISEKSGVSKAVISKIERNKCSAEIDTIYRLARVFGMSASDILRLAELSSARRTKAVSYFSDGFKFETIGYGNVRCLFGGAGKGAKTSKPEVHRDDYELCWVLSGKLLVKLPHERILLSRGDAIQFDALLAHEYEAIEDCSILLVHISKDKRF